MDSNLDCSRQQSNIIVKVSKDKSIAENSDKLGNKYWSTDI